MSTRARSSHWHGGARAPALRLRFALLFLSLLRPVQTGAHRPLVEADDKVEEDWRGRHCSSRPCVGEGGQAAERRCSGRDWSQHGVEETFRVRHLTRTGPAYSLTLGLANSVEADAWQPRTRVGAHASQLRDTHRIIHSLSLGIQARQQRPQQSSTAWSLPGYLR